MLSNENINEDINLYSIWNEFIKNNNKNVIKGVDDISPVIIRSWERCRNVDPDINPYKQGPILPLKKLEDKRGEYKELISLASPIINDICFAGDETFVMLADYEGCILEMAKNVKHDLPALGTKCREEDIGTNAIGTALKEGGFVEIKKFQHYSSYLHEISCAALPIRNSEGEIIGVIDLSSLNNTLQVGMIGMLKMGVHLIECQLQQKTEGIEINQRWESLKNSIYPYMLIFDSRGKVLDMNRRCLTILGKGNQYDNLVLSDIIKDDKDILASMIYDKTGHLEFKLKDDDNNKNYRVINKCVIKDHDGKSKTLLLFKESKLNTGEKHFFSFPDIIGEKVKWRNEVISIAKRSANVSSSVLIEGESGTGKELIAQAIHTESKRQGPFVAINCGAIPKELIESELFGYEDGAFTGAKKGGMKGKFETANGGTLFLDEIGEMPPEMQVRLLRFLQDKTVTRIGGSSPLKVDVRIISATNKNLREEVNEGRFRLDLYYRLNVINIHLPPLRERKEDIANLVDHFVAKYTSEFQRELLYIDDSTMNILYHYQWPGNVRELSNVIENAVVFTEGDVILPKVLPPYMKEDLNFPQETKGILKDNEKEIIISTLGKHAGNISRTAKDLGISRNALYNKLKIYNINVKRYKNQ